jgi:UDP-N-acetylglucosamine 2-epimerase (non-hydrolysing)
MRIRDCLAARSSIVIHAIIGTKAQLIKMAPVLRAIRERGGSYRYISTGQHSETMDDILADFQLSGPDYRLYKGRDITSIPAMLGWMLRIIGHVIANRRRVFAGDRGGIVLVHGDTFSTILGALIGRIAGHRVGHVESGLRSFNMFHPFPEELTRMATIRLSDVLFCPGEKPMANVTGQRGVKVNTYANTLRESVEFALKSRVAGETQPSPPKEPYAIVTLHRFDNIFSRAALQRVVDIVLRASQKQKLLFVLHKPTERKLREYGLYERICCNPKIECRQRCSYFPFLRLVAGAEFVISDGGSNQEECAYMGKPILLLRMTTEREEGLGANCVISRYDMRVIDDFLDNYQKLCKPLPPPDRSASTIIAEHCLPYA